MVSNMRLAATTLVLTLLTLAPAVSAQSLDQIVDELDSTGRYVELTETSDIDSAIDIANGQGVGFAWLDTDRRAEDIALDLLLDLDERNSRYKTVLVLTNSGVWSESFSENVESAANASFDEFRRGAVADGLTTFSSTLSGESSGSSGIGAWFWILLLAIIGFFGFRYVAGRRRTKKAEAELLELDRVEVKEQVRDNADRVIELGDKVIASGDAELIRIYEEASQTFTLVSTEVDGVTTIEAMNRLDDRMDHAEWQFEVIEAKLEGRTPPTAPTHDDSDPHPGPSTPAGSPDRQPPPPTAGTRGSRGARRDEPALGRDESIFGDRRPTPRTRRRPARRTSGGLGGLGGLGGVLGSIILGGGLGRPRTSRRSQQRRASTGSWTGGRSRNADGGFGSLGGGVLRRSGGGGTATRSRRSSGGGSFGGRSGRRSGGGGRF